MSTKILLVKLILAVALATEPANKIEADEARIKELVRNFCDALQASGVCDDLSMRLDTRKKVETIVGGKVGGPGGVHHSDCVAAMFAWDGENEAAYCRRARKRYDCRGAVERGLLQDAITNEKGVFCEYKKRK